MTDAPHFNGVMITEKLIRDQKAEIERLRAHLLSIAETSLEVHDRVRNGIRALLSDEHSAPEPKAVTEGPHCSTCECYDKDEPVFDNPQDLIASLHKLNVCMQPRCSKINRAEACGRSDCPYQLPENLDSTHERAGVHKNGDPL